MNLIDELREKKLVQWSIAYLAGAFATLQVIDVIAGQFGWPGEVQRGITLLLAVGFFVVLVLAWYHGERGAQTVSGAELLILALLFAIGGTVVWYEAPESTSEPPRNVPSAESTSANPIHSIAVLPLDNYSGDPAQEYFAEGITDELTAELAMVSSLRVISRGSATQFKGDQRPSSPEIARVLNVDAIIEGSVRRLGDRVRITAQLIDAREDRHLWAKTYDRNSTDVLALQGELAAEIAREVDAQLTPDESIRLARAQTVNPEAYDAYLQGRYFFNRPSDENLSKAIQQFERAAQIDPTFAPAYSGLSDAYLWAGFNESVFTATEAKPKAREAAEHAVQLEPQSAEAITSLAIFKAFYEYDWAASEALFRRAFAINDNYAYAHDQFALVLAFLGRFDESIRQSQRAASLDPLSPQVPIDWAIAEAWRGQLDEARAQAARAAYLDPELYEPPWTMGWIELQAGHAVDAVPKLEKAAAMEPPHFIIAWLGYAYGVTGDRTRALAAVEQLNGKSIRGYVAPFSLAIVYLGLGDHDKAMTYLERAYAMDSQWLGWLAHDRIFDPVRSDPRFVQLLRKLGLEN